MGARALPRARLFESITIRKLSEWDGITGFADVPTVPWLRCVWSRLDQIVGNEHQIARRRGETPGEYLWGLPKTNHGMTVSSSLTRDARLRIAELSPLSACIFMLRARHSFRLASTLQYMFSPIARGQVATNGTRCARAVLRRS